MAVKEDRLLNVEQVRQRLNCSRSYVYQLIETGSAGGGLDGLRIGRVRGIKVPMSEVERFIGDRKMAEGE